jgi:prepilin-type N-terminal cleavage/methylation domain-containing protein
MKTRTDPIAVNSAEQAGFTLIEILVALSVLLVGMAGVISLFSTGLSLERKSSTSIDAAVALQDVIPKVHAEMELRLKGSPEAEAFRIQRTKLDGWVGFDYSADAIPIVGAVDGSAYLLKVTVIPQGQPEEDGYSYGYLPLSLGVNYEDLVRAAKKETLESGQKH